MIRWFANNAIAANFLMLAILLAGVYTAIFHVPLEVSPTLSWNTVGIRMDYRGGTAKDVERAILIPIEQSLEGVSGIKYLHADARRGSAEIWVRAEEGANLREMMDDIKARVDAIDTFPDETEQPEIFIPDSSKKYEVLTVAVTGSVDQHGLMQVARRVTEDLLELPGISLCDMVGDRPFEISVEAKADKLLSYGLSFQDLADAIRRFSIDLPAGAIDSESGTYVVRTRGQAYSVDDFARIPIRSANGAEVLLGEIATIHDGFEEGEKRVEFNGKPALFVEVMRTGKESAIEISDTVRTYVAGARTRFPEGIDLFVYDDSSLSIRGRLSTLGSSLLQGSLLVLLLLGLFLRPALAFWIVIGIPVGFAGGALLMPWFGVTANVMSVFGYIIVVGIVVDDAIVTGENIYAKIREGMPSLEAAVEGTHEVATPVTFGALTTMVAFIPLMFFDGRWGDFARQIPPVVAPVLLFSLIESKFVLPSHLRHLSREPANNLFSRLQARIANGLEVFVARVYQPMLRLAARNRAAVLAGFAAMGMAIAGYCLGGHMGFVQFPKVDRNRISMMLELPSDTSLETTQQYMDRISMALEQVREEFVDPGTGKSLIQNVSRTTGAGYTSRPFEKNRGYISVEIMDPDNRSEPGPRNSEIARRWTEIIGPIDEAREFRVYAEASMSRRDNDDSGVSLELRGPSSPQKFAIAEEIRDMLAGYDGISTASAKINYGQDELELSLKPRAAELGLTQALLAQQVRQGFYGEEAQRVQRGIDDIRVMVRLPRAARETLHTLDQMKIRTPRGCQRSACNCRRPAFHKSAIVG